MNVRPLRSSETIESARLHYEVLGAEFLARCGERFLRSYHRAWRDSAYAIAIAAVDDGGRITGVLLGSVHPEPHFRSMVRAHGPALVFRLGMRAISNPTFARELIGTRALRYARGLLRMLRTALVRRMGRRPQSNFNQVVSGSSATCHHSTPSQASSTDLPGREAGTQGSIKESATGEVTHLMVREDARGSGVGRALLDEASTIARAAGLDELVLVTPPDFEARLFYEHLGWEQIGVMTSRSGESFLRFRLSMAKSIS